MTTSALSAEQASVAPGVGPRQEMRRRRLVVACVAAFMILAAVCGWRLYVDLRPVVSRDALLIGAMFAAVPVLPLVALAIWLGRYRLEPPLLLTMALLWGGLIATYLALHLNSWIGSLIGDQSSNTLLSAVFVAPWVEETCKCTVIFAIAWWRRHLFGGVIAGIVYGSLAGIGFAFTENIVYYAQVYQRAKGERGAHPWSDVEHLFVWRGVAAPFIHPMFTLMTGACIGLAVCHRHVGVRILAPAVGFTGAVLLHMSYNTAASLAQSNGLMALYLGVLLPAFLGVVVAILLIRRHDLGVIRARLGDFTTYGWLRDDQVDYFATTRGRRTARRYVRRLGSAERRKLRRLQRAAVDLAVERDRSIRGVAGPRETSRQADQIARLRRMLATTTLPGAASARDVVISASSSW